MSKRVWVAAYRVSFAVLAIVAVSYQLYDGFNSNPDFRSGNFFSFFTVQSNIFAACVLVSAVVLARRDPQPEWFSFVRGAAVLYLGTTGIVYGVLLSGYQEELQTTIPWVDTVVHRIIPIVMIADWLIDPPAISFQFRRAMWWISYPLVYLTYSLVRGPIVDWYPYPFLDPGAAGGYGAVALYCVAIAAGIALFAWLVLLLGNARMQDKAQSQH